VNDIEIALRCRSETALPAHADVYAIKASGMPL
jgi:hypothetical protein